LSNSIIEPLVLLLILFEADGPGAIFKTVKLHPNVQAIINRMFNLFTHAASTREKKTNAGNIAQQLS
jgi:hypothetical protein